MRGTRALAEELLLLHELRFFWYHDEYGQTDKPAAGDGASDSYAMQTKS